MAVYGLWVGNLVRGELSAVRANAATFLSDVAGRPDSPEAGVAHRMAGMTHWYAGEYVEAREHLERALALFQPGRDDDLAFRFGHDAVAAAMLNLATVLWPMGDIGRAVSLAGEAEARIAAHPHIGTRAYGRNTLAAFEQMRGDVARAAPNVVELLRLAREHDLPLFQKQGLYLEGWVRAETGALEGGLADMRRAFDLLGDQNVLWEGLIKFRLADVEARAGDVDRAIAVLDEAQATCERTGHHSFEAELHRVRGEMLLKRCPTIPAPPEEALRSAIAVARRQGTRSFELRAALSLAKLLQSTDRPVDAHAVLASALEGFMPTPEMPETAEGEELLAELAKWSVKSGSHDGPANGP